MFFFFFLKIRYREHNFYVASLDKMLQSLFFLHHSWFLAFSHSFSLKPATVCCYSDTERLKLKNKITKKAPAGSVKQRPARPVESWKEAIILWKALSLLGTETSVARSLWLLAERTTGPEKYKCFDHFSFSNLYWYRHPAIAQPHLIKSSIRSRFGIWGSVQGKLSLFSCSLDSGTKFEWWPETWSYCRSHNEKHLLLYLRHQGPCNVYGQENRQMFCFYLHLGLPGGSWPPALTHISLAGGRLIITPVVCKWVLVIINGPL